ncbi:putative transposase [Mycobacterium avium subsp. avium 2285 (R)]|nr:putative transposase [Mycobacterium avium subsp. avium 2285 (R)]
MTVVPDEPAPAAAGPESSIVAALRLRLTAKDAQIAELKAALRERDQTIAVLHGEIDKLHAGS